MYTYIFTNISLVVSSAYQKPTCDRSTVTTYWNQLFDSCPKSYEGFQVFHFIFAVSISYF